MTSEPRPLPPGVEAAVAAMPKVELHVHVEGAQRPDTVWAMAQRNGVALPAPTPEAWRAFYRYRDFAHFIQVYIAASRAIRAPRDFTDMLVAFHADQAAQGIVYTEAFLSASLYVEGFDQGAVLEAIAEGLALGRAQSGVVVRLIPDIARQVPDTQRAVLAFTLAGQKAGVFIGLGLGGLEAGYPPALFTEVFAEARRNGLRVVAHAGEGAGAESVRGAVEALGAERIGHGIRCLEDPGVVAMLRERQVPLEVCPMSNYRTGVVAADAPHPVFAMLEAGLNVTVHSDDPPMFDTTLTDEFRFLARGGVSPERLRTLTVAAAEASFLPDDERERLVARVSAQGGRAPGV
ncbi:MAG: adenosine deaminase [Gemmatimonadetes bacterium]|nr:adenosine deaminase [Gemmatimonadota bacterium]